MDGSILAVKAALRTCLIVVLLIIFGLGAIIFAGPIRSGALFLLWPASRTDTAYDLPATYQPLHKGYVDQSTGLYVREDENLVVRGAPPLILRRTYLSNYQVSKQFGIGTTHNGEVYLIGDGQRFQWAALILADGGRIQFERTSAGTSVWSAMFEHRATPSEWQGARLGWIGLGWALRKSDGTLMRFQGCSPRGADTCSIVELREPDGHAVQYRRDARGRLSTIDAGERWIAFDYDAQNRITRAYASNRDEARYEYDTGGRLSVVSESNGTVHRYGYTSRHHMARIEEPGTTIENSYDDDGRCIRQVNHFRDADDYDFDFTYHVENGAVVQTDSSESDGSWERLTFGSGRYVTAATRSKGGRDPATITYERDPGTNIVTGLTVTCPDRSGRPLHHSSPIAPGEQEWTEWDLLRTHCFHGWKRHAPQ